MGALRGIRVLELAGVGPVPFSGMVLADLGAEVIRVDRLPEADPYAGAPGAGGPLGRGRASISVDLRDPAGAGVVQRLAAQCDVFLEGYRPGVAERLQLGPKDLMAGHPRLVYGRMTGYGQDGPLATDAGHDITYIAMAGVLSSIGAPDGPPVPPLNLVADFGGGAMSLVVGVLSALLERERSGEGQLVDIAMTDAAAYLATMTRHMLAVGAWRDEPGSNLLDGGAPHYRCYRTADDRYVAVGALEPQFWAQLLDVLDLADEELPSPYDESSWPVLGRRLAQVIGTRTRDEWASLASGRDACLAPVLIWDEVPSHPHHRHRGSYGVSAGSLVAEPPFRLSRTQAALAPDPTEVGADTGRVLAEAGFAEPEIDDLRAAGVVH